MQGLFIVAIQLATLATFAASVGPGGGGGNCRYSSCAAVDSVSSFGEALLNAELVRGPAVNGAMPVLLAQTALQRAGLRWSYTLVVTGVACLLAAVIQLAGRGDGVDEGAVSLPGFESLWGRLRAAEAVAPCGGNPSLQAYCVATLLRFDDVDLPVVGLSLACVALPWLAGDMVLASEMGQRWWFGSDGGGRVRNLISGSRGHGLRRSVRIFSETVWVLLQALLFLGVALYLSRLADMASRVGLGSSQWTYGQLIAATVWAPILTKYAYYNICELPPNTRMVGSAATDWI